MKIEFLYVDPNFNVTFCTPGCTSILGVTLDMIMSGLKISSLIEGFENRLAEFQTSGENGVLINLKIFPDNILISCNCRVQLVRAHTDYFYLIQLIIQPNAVSKARYDPNSSRVIISPSSKSIKAKSPSSNILPHNLTPTHSERNTPKNTRRSFSHDHSADVAKILSSMPEAVGKKSLIKPLDSPAFKSNSYKNSPTVDNQLLKTKSNRNGSFMGRRPSVELTNSFMGRRPSVDLNNVEEISLKIDTSSRNNTTRLSNAKLLADAPKDLYLSNKEKDPTTLSQHSGGGSSQGSRTSTLSGTSTMHGI